ncbi:hypothetical protein M1N64_04685, partial [Peptococcaceae bacterium]|nr:hypothetical protein [Peptococcaceae bacterium]
PLDKAFSGGSVFKIEFTSDLDEKLKSKLESLVIDGLGERTNEGFGRVHVNIETLISGNKYTRKKIEAPKVDKPLDSPPELIKKIFTAVVRENISEFVIREAVRKSENFAKGDSLSTNLLGRLELILKEAKDAQDFVEKIRQLRKTAQDKLKASRDNSETLWV